MVECFYKKSYIKTKIVGAFQNFPLIDITGFLKNQSCILFFSGNKKR